MMFALYELSIDDILSNRMNHAILNFLLNNKKARETITGFQDVNYKHL
jgi:hypothetical protein